jgi:hypothetical protein
MAHWLFISPGIKEERRLRDFGKGRDQTLIIMPFVRKNWVIAIENFPRVHNYRWGERAKNDHAAKEVPQL